MYKEIAQWCLGTVGAHGPKFISIFDWKKWLNMYIPFISQLGFQLLIIKMEQLMELVLKKLLVLVQNIKKNPAVLADALMTANGSEMTQIFTSMGRWVISHAKIKLCSTISMQWYIWQQRQHYVSLKIFFLQHHDGTPQTWQKLLLRKICR